MQTQEYNNNDVEDKTFGRINFLVEMFYGQNVIVCKRVIRHIIFLSWIRARLVLALQTLAYTRFSNYNKCRNAVKPKNR